MFSALAALCGNEAAQTVSGGGGNSAAYTNFIARTSGLDSTHLTAYADLLNGLTTDGLFNSDGSSSYLDVLTIYATKDSTTAKLNLVSSSYSTTTTSGFLADNGFDIISGDVPDTNFNASTAGGNYTQDSACIGVWVFSSGNIGNGYRIYAGAPAHIQLYNDGGVNIRVNDDPASSGFNIGTPNSGFYLGNRSSSTARQGYFNNVSIGTYGSQASGAPANLTFSTGSQSPGDEYLASYVIGGSLNSTLAGNLYTRLRTYMTAVGVP